SARKLEHVGLDGGAKLPYERDPPVLRHREDGGVVVRTHRPELLATARRAEVDVLDAHVEPRADVVHAPLEDPGHLATAARCRDRTNSPIAAPTSATSSRVSESAEGSHSPCAAAQLALGTGAPWRAWGGCA